jgi:hypothetical protein
MRKARSLRTNVYFFRRRSQKRVAIEPTNPIAARPDIASISGTATAVAKALVVDASRSKDPDTMCFIAITPACEVLSNTILFKMVPMQSDGNHIMPN